MRNPNKSTTYTYTTGTTYTFDTTLAKRIRLIRQLYTYMKYRSLIQESQSR